MRRFRLETEREHLSALFGLWVGLWTMLLLGGGVILTLNILRIFVHEPVAIGGMILYVILSMIIFWARTKRLIYRLASAMVEMDAIKSLARKKTLGEKVRNNG